MHLQRRARGHIAQHHHPRRIGGRDCRRHHTLHGAVGGAIRGAFARAVVVVDRVDRGDPGEAGAVGDRVTSGAGHRPAAAHYQRESEREHPGAIHVRASDGVTWYGDLITYRLEREPPPKRRSEACADREGSAAAGTSRAGVRAPRSPAAAAGVKTTPNTPPTRRATTAPRHPE